MSCFQRRCKRKNNLAHQTVVILWLSKLTLPQIILRKVSRTLYQAVMSMTRVREGYVWNVDQDIVYRYRGAGCFWAMSQNCEKAITRFVMSAVRLHATTRPPLDGFSWNFEHFSKNLPTQFKSHYNLTTITGTLHADRHTFVIISCWVLLVMGDVSDNSCGENENTRLLYTNICTNKYCKFILKYCDMFRCQYTIFREFAVVLAEVMDYYSDKIQYSGVWLS